MIDMKEEPPLSAESARELLLHLMRRDSEQSHAAGWVVGNEFRLWCQVVRDRVVAGELRQAVLYTFTSRGPLPRPFRIGEIVKVVVLKVIGADNAEAEGGDDGSQRESGG